MATDNLQLSTAVGTGDVLRSLFDSDGVEYVAGLCAYPTSIGSPSASTISLVDLTHGLPVQQQTGATFAVTGTFWQATQPVSIAAAVPVTDNGGSLTVDGTVAATQSGSWSVTANAGTGNFAVAGAQAVGATATANPVLIAGMGILGTVTTFQTRGGGAMLVYGENADGGLASGNPVPAGGSDGTFIHYLLTDSSGRQIVNINGTVTVSGAVTNAGTFVVQESGAALTSLQLIDDVVFAEDAAASSGDKGIQVLAVRRDAAASSSTTDGDYSTLNVDSTGRLWCNVSNTLTVASHDVTNAGTFAVQAAQSGTWNITNVSGTVSLPTGAATAAKQPALGTAGTASADVITVQGIASMTALKVDGSGVTQPVSGTVTATIAAGATTIAKAEDAASADADVGVPAMAVRKASPANTSGLDGDYEMLQMSAGRLWTSATIDASLPAGTNGIGKLTSNSGVTIGAVEIAAAQTLATVTTVGTVSAVTGGGTAHDGAAGSINPLLVGAYASAAAPTDVNADTDAVRLWALRSGALATQPTFAGVLAVAGNGASGTGVQRVTIANDSTGILAGVTTVTTLTTCSTVTTLTGGGVSHDGPAGSVKPHLTGGFASAAAPADVSADGDATQFWCLRNGAQAIQPTYAGVLATTGNGASGTGVPRVTIANDSTGILAGVTTVTTVTTLSTLTGGGVAHDGVDSGNPVKIGARAAATLSDDTMVANADRTDVVSDLDGAVITRDQFPLGDLVSERVSNTDGNSTAFSNFTNTANVRNYITAISVFNSSATTVYVDFRDGTAGSVLYTLAIPAGGGAVMASNLPLFRTSANTALAFDVSSAVSTVYISVSGFRSKV